MKKEISTIDSLIRERRTIHDFIPDKKPDEDLIKEAIELARWAPNHHLTEPWHFYLIGPETADAICLLNSGIVRNKKGEEAADKKLKRWRSVPGWLLVTCDVSAEDSLKQHEDYSACCCVVQNLSLTLWDKGIGCKWTSGDVIRDSRFYELVWVDETQEVAVGLIWYGYPEEIPNGCRSPLEQCLIELP